MAKKFKLSKKEKRAELKRCINDPVYFINNYCKIAHPLKGKISFKTYDYQDEIVNALNTNSLRFNIVLKARQLGLSTITSAYVTWLILFRNNKEVLVVATKEKTAAKLVKKVKLAYDNLPDWIKIRKKVRDSATVIELENGSSITASSTSSDAGRSESLSFLIIDEAAHVDGMNDLWTAIYPTLSTGGRCLVISTPAGCGNFFHKTYIDAEVGANDFNAIMIPWDAHPERDQEWFDKETRNMTKQQIAQELLCNFNTSGESVFGPEDMERLKKEIKEPLYKTGFDRNFWIWERYEHGAEYLMSVDVARGDAKDFSAFHIFRLDTMEIVGEYQGKQTPDVFSNLIFNVGKEYGNCMIVVENNSIGYTVVDKLIGAEYPNVYHSVKSTNEYIEQHVAEQRTGCVAGFSMTQRTRPLVIAKMEEFIRNGIVKINSQRLINEMTTFIYNNGRPEAMETYNDDLIMSAAIGCWVRDTALTVNKRELDYKKAFLGSCMKSTTAIDTKIPGMVGYRPPKGKLDDKTEEDLLKKYHWLFKG